MERGHSWLGAAIGGALLATTGIAPLRAQALLLQLRPRVGDTLVMRLDQTSRLTTTRQTVGGKTDVQAAVTNEMQVYSHAVVASRSTEGTILLAVTDSVVMTSSDPRTRASDAQTAAKLRGQRTRICIAPDGGLSVLSPEDDGSDPPRGMAEAVSLMPATFPRSPVTVETTWHREMRVPAGVSAFGTSVGGRVQATFRLDSASRGGQMAHVSMRGELRPDAGPYPTTTLLQSGTLTGTLVVDRSRGWLAESNVTVVALSVMLPIAGLAGTGMRLEMTVTQHMRLIER